MARKTEAVLSAGMIQAENPTAEMCKQPIQIMHRIYEIASDVVLETRVLVSRRLEDNNESLGLGLGSTVSIQHNAIDAHSVTLFYYTAGCGAVYCNRSCLFVCVCVFVGGSVTTITRNCVHRSSRNWVCR